MGVRLISHPDSYFHYLRPVFAWGLWRFLPLVRDLSGLSQHWICPPRHGTVWMVACFVRATTELRKDQLNRLPNDLRSRGLAGDCPAWHILLLCSPSLVLHSTSPVRFRGHLGSTLSLLFQRIQRSYSCNGWFCLRPLLRSISETLKPLAQVPRHFDQTHSRLI